MIDPSTSRYILISLVVAIHAEIRSLRNRLGLSRANFGKLLGATPHAVYLWEKKEGPLRLRDKTKAALLSIKGLGAREAKEKLAEAETTSKRMRASSSKTKKTR